MAGWYTFGIEFLLPMILTLSINNAVGFTSLKSWFFFTKINFYPKLLEHYNYPRHAFKRACKALHIDTNVHFHRYQFRGEHCKICWFFANFSKICLFLETKLSDISQVTNRIKKIIYTIIESTKSLLLHIHLIFIPLLEVTKVEYSKKITFPKTQKLQIAL